MARERMNRLEAAQWTARARALRTVTWRWLHLVLFAALLMGVAIDLYRTLAARVAPEAVAAGDLAGIAALVALVGVMPFLFASQMGWPVPAVLKAVCGLAMVGVPQLFLPHLVPHGFVLGAGAGLAVCAAIMGAVWWVTRLPGGAQV